MSIVDSFGSKGKLNVAGAEYEIFRLNSVEGAENLPFSLKVLLENLLRTEDGANITADTSEHWPAGTPAPSPTLKSSSRRRA
jgi:aconitate hydratase